ncbi:MAG: shikimate dehydrogenase [Nitrospirae bacterium]|nr:shikimate dehydrogenase [Nitrospirota bacterium]
MKITGTTRVLGIFGYPVAHTLSPAMHNAALEALGIEACYLPFEVASADLPGAIEGIRSLGLLGVNLTIPHKEAALPLMDALSEEAARVGAVNTVEVRENKLVGHNTDGLGFVRFLREDQGLSLDGRRVLALGAGGAGRAISFACAGEHATQIVIANRSKERGERLAADLRRAYPKIRISVAPLTPEALDGVFRSGIDLIVQTTPMGMRPEDPAPIPPELIEPHHVVCDIVYLPEETPLLQAARLRGASLVGGLGMLLHQGALAFELWTGRPAPLPVMREALQNELARRKG